MRELTLLKIIQKTFNLSHVAENQPDDYKKHLRIQSITGCYKKFQQLEKNKKTLWITGRRALIALFSFYSSVLHPRQFIKGIPDQVRIKPKNKNTSSDFNVPADFPPLITDKNSFKHMFFIRLLSWIIDLNMEKVQKHIILRHWNLLDIELLGYCLSRVREFIHRWFAIF